MMRPQLVIALDVADEQMAIALASKFRGRVGWLKVGLELYIRGGRSLVASLKDMGYNVFLDLKFYDIPNTVAGAVRSACSMDIDMLTIHCQGGERMCAAALSALPGHGAPLIAGVTALTSFADGEMPGIAMGCREYGIYLAGLAASWGMPAVVCSPMEAREIRIRWPELKLVCPGIRMPEDRTDDQRRVMTPASAAAAGADFLVMGRSIIGSPNPEGALETVLGEIG